MSYFSRYDKGEWAVLCDVCGRKFRNQDLRQRWDGLKTCKDDWETRQPQDFVRGVADYQAPVWTRPEPSDSFIPVEIIYDNDGQPIFPLFYSTATVALKAMANRVRPYSTVVSNTTVLSVSTIYSGYGYGTPVNGASINKKPLG